MSKLIKTMRVIYRMNQKKKISNEQRQNEKIMNKTKQAYNIKEIKEKTQKNEITLIIILEYKKKIKKIGKKKKAIK